MKKKLIAIFIIFTLSISTALPTYAATTNTAANTESINQADIQKLDGTFQSSSSDGTIHIDGGVQGNYVKCTTMSTSTASQKFVNYLTSSWAKASSYTWQNSVSTSWSLGGSTTADITSAIKAQIVATFSRTTSYSVAITIPATSTKLSKLGFFSDFNDKYVKSETINYYTKNVLSTQYNHVYEPLSNTYLMVVYS